MATDSVWFGVAHALYTTKHDAASQTLPLLLTHEHATFYKQDAMLMVWLLNSYVYATMTMEWYQTTMLRW